MNLITLFYSVDTLTDTGELQMVLQVFMGVTIALFPLSFQKPVQSLTRDQFPNQKKVDVNVFLCYGSSITRVY